MWARHRGAVLAGLRTIVDDEPFVLADLGYRSEAHPELITCDRPNPALNARRLVVENYFGRMVQMFAAARHRFRLGTQHFDTFVRALCHATNRTVEVSPLRQNDYLHYRAVISNWQSHEDKRRAAHRAAVAKSRNRISQGQPPAKRQKNK